MTRMTRYEFRFVPAADESVDAEYQVLLCGVPTRLAIQCCEDGQFAVIEYGFKKGEVYSMNEQALFAALDSAKLYAVSFLTRK